MKARIHAGVGRTPWTSTPIAGLLAALLAALLALFLQRLGNPQHQLKAGLGVVAVAVLLAAALRPVFALGLVVALMPFEYHVYGLGTNEVLIFSAAVVLVWRIQGRRVPWWAALSSFALVIGSFLTVIGAHNQGSALWGTARWLGVLILLAAAYSLLHARPDANRRLMDIITASALVVVGFAVLQRAGIYTIVGAPYISDRVDSTFGYYTVYGGFIGMAAVLATGEALHSFAHGQRSRGLTYGGALTIILIGVAISLSRGSLLCVGAGWVVLLVLNLRQTAVLVRGVALIAVFIVAGYLATPPQTRTTLINRFATPVGTQAEDQQRFALQQTGQKALAQNPLGIGYGNFSAYLATHPTHGLQVQFFHTHELPIQIGLDAGWLGLAGFLGLFAAALGTAIRCASRGAIRNTAFAAALCGLMAQGLFDYLFYEISMLALWTALVFGATHLATAPATRP